MRRLLWSGIWIGATALYGSAAIIAERQDAEPVPFADAALQVYTFAKPLLKPGYEVHLPGHSLGGAAAAILLMLFKEDGVTLGSAITFGQPKVTNSQGVTTYRLLPLLRFVNDRDPVPLLPPLDLFSLLDDGPYKHFAPEVVLKDGPHYVYFAEHQA